MFQHLTEQQQVDRLRQLGRDKGETWSSYTERDAEPWYVLAGDRESWHGIERVAEGFQRREDARAFLAWLLGDAPPSGWCITCKRDRSYTLTMPNDRQATIWRKEVARTFPIRAGILEGMLAGEALPT